MRQLNFSLIFDSRVIILKESNNVEDRIAAYIAEQYKHDICSHFHQVNPTDVIKSPLEKIQRSLINFGAELSDFAFKSEYEKEIAKWAQCKLIANDRENNSSWSKNEDFDRFVRVYSSDLEEQKAFENLCSVIFQVGDILKDKPQGFRMITTTGEYFLSDITGSLKLYIAWDIDHHSGFDSCVITATDTTELGASALDDIAKDLANSMKKPQFEHIDQSMLDALVLFYIVDESTTQC